MKSSVFLLSIGIATSAMLTPFLWIKNAVAQENTYALCESGNYTVRVYSSNGQTLMRAYDRQQAVVWMNQTPVRTETISQGIAYSSTRGEQTVKVLVNGNTKTCTIRVGTRSPQQGKLLAYQPNSDAALAQARQLYPTQVAKLQAQCKPPKSLSVTPYQNSGQPQRGNFNCWSPPEASGARSGQWLGTLPLTANDPTFIKPTTCVPGDTQCQAHLSLMQSRYPQELQQAEFACAMRKGSLFFAQRQQALDLRCGYSATSLYDENGDGFDYLEQSTSVDISVGTLPLPG